MRISRARSRYEPGTIHEEHEEHEEHEGVVGANVPEGLVSDRELLGRSTCSALVITCSDFRFKRAEQAFAAAALLDDYDLIARPGGIRSLVLPRNEAARQSMTEEMMLLWRLHRFERVLMLNHLSCRAYDDIATPANERQLHARHLAEAGPIVSAMLDGARAEAYVVGAGDDGVLGVTGVRI